MKVYEIAEINDDNLSTSSMVMHGFHLIHKGVPLQKLNGSAIVPP